MAALFCSFKTLCSFAVFHLIKKASTHTGFSFAQPPTGREYAGRDWRSRFIVRNGKRFPLPIRPPACCSGCPHRAEVSLWLPLGLPAMGSPAPDAACCLPSPVTVFRFTPYGAGRSWRSSLSGATLSRGNLLKPLHTGIQLSSFLHSGGKPIYRIKESALFFYS